MLLLFQATATQLADSTQIVADKLMEEAIANADGLDKLSLITQQLVDFGIRAGERILIATLVFIVGRFLISMLNRFVGRLMDRRKVDISIKTFVKSLVNILLTILLIISVVGALGVETTSFAALLASAGVAVGMALSGNLQNFAGGLIVLLFKPYKVGDWIESQGVSGTVKEIQIFHTILTTGDNKVIYIPNGAMIFQAVIVSYASYLVWNFLLKQYLAARLGVLVFMTPIFGVILSVLLLGESVGMPFVFGSLLVLAGLLLMQAKTILLVKKHSS